MTMFPHHTFRCGIGQVRVDGVPAVHTGDFPCDCPCHEGWFGSIALDDPASEAAQAVNADGLAEAETIDMAQYRALHDRLEDFTVWLVEKGYLPTRSILVEPTLGQEKSLNHPDAQDNLFEMIEAYLDQATEAEDRSPLVQILQPKMDDEQ